MWCWGRRLLRDGEPISPMPTPEQLHEASRKFEATVRDRAAAIRLIESSRDEVLAALPTMTEARYATSPPSPFGALPMDAWMRLAETHMSYHAAQLNYLQTIWGDLVDHA